jgi:hypothetical protein
LLLFWEHNVFQTDVVVAAIEGDNGGKVDDALGEHQRADAQLPDTILYLETGKLPEEVTRARELVVGQDLFILETGVLYRVQPDKPFASYCPPRIDSSCVKRSMGDCLQD